MTPLIALTGYARTGKDSVADVLVAEYAYIKRSMGDIIKAQVLYFASRRTIDHDPFYEWLEYTGRTAARVRDVQATLRYVREHVLSFEPFHPLTCTYGITEHVKQFLRPVLEEYGNWQYESIMREYFDTLPAKCVNNRLCRVEEAREWKARGGQIWLVTRPGVLAATEQEARWIDELRDGGFIDWTIPNKHIKLDRLAQQVRDLVTIVEAESARTKGTMHEHDY